ncbi:hypothetical protein D3C76_752910 [compost metagenome]
MNKRFAQWEIRLLCLMYQRHFVVGKIRIVRKLFIYFTKTCHSKPIHFTCANGTHGRQSPNAPTGTQSGENLGMTDGRV